MRYRDPLSGRQVAKSAGTSSRKDAERAAAKWEEDLRKGRYQAPSKLSWEAFRERYEDEVLTGMAAETRRVVATVFNTLEQIVRPTWLRD